MAFLILQLLFRRTLLAIPILLCVSALVFIIMRLLPVTLSPCPCLRVRHWKTMPN